ncbi:caspase family protein [Roseomonas sp. HJA6]|uniref:Caspase family protein n=1 Tax=Roseomonas alba TaxID=2846776 RepID=A0ABS7A8Q3_9PROT|nr:caspase family protein [Neoroseomonas alba]MBW6398681.1 caspase family protein [Neoroseomonas alba]
MAVRRLLRGLVLAATIAVCGPAQAQAPAEPPQQPFLRIEAGAHIAPIGRLATTADGGTLATVSDDKTLRLWNLPEGTERLVIRPPMGPEAEGELYAVALTPDGSRVAAAGYTARSWDSAFALYLFDTQTGRLAARLPGLTAPVQHLAFSADGGRLAAALGGRAGIKVWDARNGRLVFEDASFAGPARMVAFDRDGRVAAAAADGTVRLYAPDGRKLAQRVPVQGARPYGVAFSPEGALLVVGYEDRLRVEVLSTSDLRTVLVPDTSGLAGEGLPAVAWAHDANGGLQLYAGGYARFNRPAAQQGATPAPATTRTAPQRQPASSSSSSAPSPGGRGLVVRQQQPMTAVLDPALVSPPDTRREFVIRRWADFGFGAATDIPAARDAISHMVPLPQGGLVYAAADPGWGRIAPDGALAVAPRPPGGDFRNTGVTLALSADGTQVLFSLRAGGAPVIFDPLTGSLTAWQGEPGFATARTETPRIRVLDWRNSNRPRLNNVPLRLDEGEFARSLAILVRDDGFLLGTDTHIRLFDAQGRLVDSIPTPGAVWGLTVAGDMGVAALGDGTIRWYRFQAGALREQAALFVHAETLRWALWTPEGLFDHGANGGQELVGVHLNAGRNQTPEWASFQQAYRALYAPRAVRGRIAGDFAPAQERLTQLGEVRSRIGRLPTLAPGSLCAVVGTECQAIAWDARALPEGATALRMAFRATDRGLGFGPLDVLVNDRLAARAEPAVGEASVEVPLDPGSNRIATRLYASDGTLFAEGPSLTLRRPGEPDAPPGAGRLVVLAIGVNEYANRELNLRYAEPDARSVGEALRAAGTGLFRDVDLRFLPSARATRRGVLDALAAVARDTGPADTFILYIAGHGIVSPNNRFLFLPSDVRDISSFDVLRQETLDDTTLVAALSRIRARDAFIMIDTCYAGQVDIDQLAAIGNDTGRFLLAASSSVQEALDSYDDRNGVFAYALMEGLRGRAAVDAEGRVTALALGEWVMRRVPQLAREKGHQQNAVFRAAQRDLRSFPVAVVPRNGG